MDLGNEPQNPKKVSDFEELKPLPNEELISLAEAANLTPYSQEYISLLARKGKLLAWKKGRNWFTTKRAILDYLAKQAKEAESDLQKKAAFTPVVLPTQALQPSTTDIIKEIGSAMDAKLEGFKSEFQPILQDVTAKVSQVVAQTLLKPPPPPEVKVRKPRHSPLFYIIILLVALPLIFFGLTKGLADDLPAKLLNIIKNAWTLDGHKPGTEANEVLILNEAGNISIKGHIETEGQLRSYARDGVAPIIVDSTTKIANLNVDYLDDFSSEQFTLAFVTNNGNITTDDVYLKGKVEVGQTIEVKGATRLLDALLVDGSLGVWGEAIFHDDLQVEGQVTFDQDLNVGGSISTSKDITAGGSVSTGGNVTTGGGVSTGGDVVTNNHNVILGNGTIQTNNRELVKNLNAELWNGLEQDNFDLDFITDNGAITDNKITVGGLNVLGGATNLTGDLTVQGKTQLLGDTTIENLTSLTVNGTSNLRNTNIRGTLDVAGHGLFRTASVSGSMGVNDLTATQASIGGDENDGLLVSATSTLSGPINVDNTLTFIRATPTINTSTGNLSIRAKGDDTANIQIGKGGAGSVSPDLLVLDIKTDAGDPTGTPGAMYYNESTGKFRCYENGAWGDCVGGGASTLQQAYDGGNTITTTTARDLAITLADTATDSNFTVTVADGSTSYVGITRADGAGTADPAQLLLLDNLDTSRSIADGLRIQSAAGLISDAIDASDAEIVNALNVGANNIVGTTPLIDFTNFDLASTGNITVAAGEGLDTNGAGSLALGATSSTTVDIAGGSGATGCTVTNATGDLVCTGTITSSGGAAIGYWQRAGTTLSPVTAGDDVTTSGNISATGTGTITSAGLMTASNGFTLSTGALNLTATSGALTLSGLGASSISTGANNITFTAANFNTTATGINSTAIGATSPSTGAFTSLTATGATNINTSGANTTNIGTGTNSGTITIGNATTGDLALTDANWSITGPGVASFTGLSSTGNLNFTGAQVLGGSPLVFEGTTDDNITLILALTDPTVANKTITFPNATGTVAVSATSPVTLSALGDIGCSTCLVTGSSIFTLAGTAGTPQTISQGDTATIAAGTDITTTAGATDTVTIANTSTLATVTGRGATTTTLVNLDGGIAVDTSNFTVSGTTGDILTAGDLAVNGGDLTTTAGTFNLVNAATTVNLGSTNIARAINIGTGTDVDTINIGTGSTGADVITIGQAAANVAITDANWSITGVGLLTTADDVAINGGDLTTSAATFNLVNANATTINFAGAGTSVNIGPSGATASSVNVVGGSGATGCTFDGATGDLTCSGSITGAATGDQGFWNRTGTTLSPSTAGDNISTSGNILTTGSGNITSAGDLAVNGATSADITTTTTTASVFNATATTVNLAGAATTLNIGAGTGTSLVNNALTSTGLITASSGISLSANQDVTLVSGTGSIIVNSSVSNASDQVVDINPSFTGGTNGLTYSIIDIAAFSPTNSTGTNNVNGLLIGNLTDPGAAISSTALNIGTGWDNVLSVGGTPVINSSGQVITTQLTGTLFTLAGTSGTPEAIVQGNTITIAAGTDITTTASATDTVTIANTSTLATVTGRGATTTTLVNLDGGIAVDTSNFTVSGTTGAVSTLGGATINRTLAADSGTTTNVASITFTTPVDTTGTNINQGLNITPTIGNATAGTNTANIINIAALTGDAQVILNALNIGALTGTAATEYALNIGAGWDSVLRVNGTEVINSTGQIPVAQLTGTLFTITDGSTPQTIETGNTLTFADGTDNDFVTSATDTVTVNNTSTLATVTGRGATTTTLVNLDGGIAVDTSNFTVSGTTGATAIAAVNSAAGSLNALALSGTLGNMDGTDTFRGVYLNYTNGTHTNSNTITGLDININSNSANATQTAINIGAAGAWDTDISLQNGETISNATNDTIILASNAANGAGVIRLPVKTTTGDPSLNVAGNIYYNSSDDDFRCYISTGWANCADTGTTITLQTAYNAGSSITTSDARDLDIVLANTTTDSNLDIDIATDSTSTVTISRLAGVGTANPSQLLLLEDLDADLTIADGLLIQSAGILTDAIDVSDAEIVNAINVGGNVILGTTANITLTNFTVTGSSGNIDTAGVIQAGSSNVNITLSTGLLDADAIGLISADGTGATSSGSGLETDTDRLGLLQGCNDGEVLKWVNASNIWQCAADVTGGAASLQAAYDGGNSITTTGARDLDIVLANTTTDSNLDIDIATDSTSTVTISRLAGVGTANPAQLLLLEDLDADLTIADGLRIQSAGILTDAIDVSDAEIVNAINVGGNTILGTTGDINLSNFDVTGSSGDIVTAGDLAVNGGDLTTSGASFNLLNATATTINFGGAATTLSVGAGSGTTTVNNALTVTLDVAINGGDLTTSASTFNLLNATATTVNFAGAGTTISIGAASGTTTVNNALTVSGLLTANAGATINRTLSADTGSTTNVASITFTTPADTTGTNVNQGINITPTIGNATAGTNTANIINIAALTGDAQVTLNALNIGALTGTAATEYALNIGSGWDSVLRVNGTEVINSTGQIPVAQLTGTLFTLAGTSGTPETIVQGNTVTIAAGTDITTTAGATDTVTIANTSTLATVTGRGATTTTLVNLDGGIAVDTSNFTVSGTTGDILTAGDLAVNGGDLTTSGSSFNLLNATATTINFAGAATTLSVGAGTGTTTVNNALTATGLITASSGISVSANQNITLVAGTGSVIINSTVSNASDKAVQIIPSFTGGTNGLAYSTISVDAFTADNSTGTDTVNGLLIGNLTETGAGAITSTALNIGTGWDNVLSVGGTPVIDGSGNIVATTINPGFTQGSVVFQGASALAQDNTNFFWDDTNNRLGIGDATPGSNLEILGYQPASVGTSPGTAATDNLTISGGIGGTTTIATTGVGGIGADVSVTGGTGGVASAAATASTGGAGGAFTVSGGTGGAAAVVASTNTGGAGGALALTAGTGGAASGGTDTGGAGGNLEITGGTGGLGDTGGVGGDIYIVGGVAGAGGSPAVGDVLLAITSGGTARGNVGIGTATTPTGLLTIGDSATTAAATVNIYGDNTGATDASLGTINLYGQSDQRLTLRSPGDGGAQANVQSQYNLTLDYNDAGTTYDFVISSNGSTKLFMDQDGLVGINDTTPDATLNVQGTFIVDDGTSNWLSISSTGGFTYDNAQGAGEGNIDWTVDFNNAFLITGNRDDAGIIFGVDDSAVAGSGLYFIDGGNVGIGTNAPSTIFHIDENAATGTGLLVTGGGAGGDLANFTRDVGSDGRIRFNVSNGDPIMILDVQTSGTVWYTGVDDSDSDKFVIGTGSAVGTAAALTINTSSLVGIGTSSPLARLQVTPGLASATTVVDRSISYGSLVSPTSGRSGVTIQTANSFLSANDEAAFMYINPFDATDASAAYKVFRIATGTESGVANNPAVTLTDRFWVRKDGGAYFENAVGIGDTTPTEGTLTVAGTGYFLTDLTVAGGDITGANSSYIDLGEENTQGFTFSNTGGTYPDFYCKGSAGTNVLCDFRSGLYVSAGTAYFQTQIYARTAIANDTASTMLSLNDADGILFGGALYGSTSASGNITIRSTSNATKGYILLADEGGSVGIGTATIPHGGIGYAKFAIDGTDQNAAGPHVQYTTAIDDRPLFQQLNWTHDNITQCFDCYYDGAFRSSDAGSNYWIRKVTDQFAIAAESGIAAGSVVTMDNVILIDVTAKSLALSTPIAAADTVGGAITIDGGDSGDASTAARVGGAVTVTTGDGSDGNASTISGEAGAFTLTTGAGGTGHATAGTGGAGGALTLTLGNGGARATSSGSSITGAGGAFSLTAGAGGAITGTITGNVGGAGGAVAISSGIGGANSVSGGAAGAGGALSLSSGTGGAETGGAGSRTGGAGGAVTITAGNGGSAGTTAGVGGAITIAAGNAGATGGNINGGDIYIYGGANTGSGRQGNVFIGNNGSGVRGKTGFNTVNPDSIVQITGGGLCVGSDANCNTDNNTEGVVYSSATAMTLYDVAENYPTKDLTLVPEEVVALDTTLGVFVKRATKADTALGVISAAPSVLLGGFNGAQFTEERQAAVALSGRVPVKFSLENGPVAIGDYLTVSSTPGVAMKAVQPGYVIGLALTTYDPVAGSVMLFVNRTYFNPSTELYLSSSGGEITGLVKVTAAGTPISLDLNGPTNLATLRNIFEAKLNGEMKFNILETGDATLAGKIQVGSLKTIAQAEFGGSLIVGGMEFIDQNRNLKNITSVAVTSSVNPDGTVTPGNIPATSVGAAVSIAQTSADPVTATRAALALSSAGTSSLDYLIWSEPFQVTYEGRVKSKSIKLAESLTVGDDNLLSGTLVKGRVGDGFTGNLIEFINTSGQTLLSVDSTGQLVADTLKTRALVIDNTDEPRATIGSAVINAGNTVAVVSASTVKEGMKIFLTPKLPLAQSLAITSVADGSFTVALASSLGTDLPFDWWVIDVTNPSLTSTVASTQSPTVAPTDNPTPTDNSGQVAGDSSSATTDTTTQTTDTVTTDPVATDTATNPTDTVAADTSTSTDATSPTTSTDITTSPTTDPTVAPEPAPTSPDTTADTEVVSSPTTVDSTTTETAVAPTADTGTVAASTAN